MNTVAMADVKLGIVKSIGVKALQWMFQLVGGVQGRKHHGRSGDVLTTEIPLVRLCHVKCFTSLCSVIQTLQLKLQSKHASCKTL